MTNLCRFLKENSTKERSKIDGHVLSKCALKSGPLHLNLVISTYGPLKYSQEIVSPTSELYYAARDWPPKHFKICNYITIPIIKI